MKGIFSLGITTIQERTSLNPYCEDAFLPLVGCYEA
jgi:hypothetical protein